MLSGGNICCSTHGNWLASAYALMQSFEVGLWCCPTIYLCRTNSSGVFNCVNDISSSSDTADHGVSDPALDEISTVSSLSSYRRCPHRYLGPQSSLNSIKLVVSTCHLTTAHSILLQSLTSFASVLAEQEARKQHDTTIRRAGGVSVGIAVDAHIHIPCHVP